MHGVTVKFDITDARCNREVCTGAILHKRASNLDLCISKHQTVMVFRQQGYSTLPFQTPDLGVDLTLVGCGKSSAILFRIYSYLLFAVSFEA